MKIGLLLPSIYASTKLFPDKIFAPRELAIDLVNGLVDRGHEVTTFSVPDLPVKENLFPNPWKQSSMPCRTINSGKWKKQGGIL